MTPEQAQEDFNILMDAYVELFPSFYDIVTPEQFEELMKRWPVGAGHDVAGADNGF